MRLALTSKMFGVKMMQGCVKENLTASLLQKCLLIA